MRVVLDSNVIIAAYAARGLCHALFELCLIEHTLFISPEILHEVQSKLQIKIKLPPSVIKDILSFLKKNATVLEAADLSHSLCRDPDDVKILGLVVSSHAECLVTGDQDLLVLGDIQSIPILSPRDFYNFLTKRP